MPSQYNNIKVTAVAATCMLLLLSYILLYINGQRIANQLNAVDHTYKVVTELEKLGSENKELDYNFLNYLNAKNSLFLTRFKSADTAVLQAYNNVKLLTQENKIHQQKLAAIQADLNEKMRLMQDGVVAIETSPNETAVRENLINTLYDRAYLGLVRRQINDMQQDELKVLADKSFELDKFSSGIKIITIISLLIALSLAIQALLAYKKHSAAKLVAQEKSDEYKAQLENRVQELYEANQEIKELKNVEKFASTGRIARTIAHEVRNPLTNINLAAEQLKECVEDSEESNMLLEMVNRNSLRINELISNLLNATKFSDLDQKETSLNKLLDDALGLAKDRIELKRIKVSTDYDPDICNIKVDEERLKIAFLNIIVNAIEAMPDGQGELSIKSKEVNGKCHISFKDNGEGMSEETLNKLFEPYFTNKQNGNGLGLTNTQNIILNHKGKIEVNSQEGEGTTFNIYLDL